MGLACLVLGPACTAPSKPRTITMAALESAPPVLSTDVRHVVVANPAALRDLCMPLGTRLGLLQIRSAAEWERVARVAPQIGSRPDLRNGTLIGLACWAGTPVDGRWPVHIDAIRIHDGAGLVTAVFEGGTYLPDGTAVIETAHVPGLAIVLAVDLNGTTFYPQ